MRRLTFLPVFRSVAAALCVLAAGVASAGLLMDAPEGGYPENAAPPPPPFDVSRTIQVDLPVGGALKLGVDPTTISIGSDGIVRYVAVLSNAGGTAYTALYEGVRCTSAEVKLYARHYADGNWRPVAEPVWQSIFDNGPKQYSLPLARAGMCRDAAPNKSAQQIVLDLKGDPLRYLP